MNLMHTLRNVGTRLFRLIPNEVTQTAAQRAQIALQDTAAGRTIANYIRSQGLDAEGLEVKYNRRAEALLVYGVVKNIRMRDRILHCCSHVERVHSVVDRMEILDEPREGTTFLAATQAAPLQVWMGGGEVCAMRLNCSAR